MWACRENSQTNLLHQTNMFPSISDIIKTSHLNHFTNHTSTLTVNTLITLKACPLFTPALLLKFPLLQLRASETSL